MIKFAALLFLVFFQLHTAKAQKSISKYIEKYKGLAIALMKSDSIPASIILGVSMLESGAGTSRNCRLLNNFFGVRGKNNLWETKKIKTTYKQYLNDTASFKDFCRIVRKKKYFKRLSLSKDYKQWLIAMNQSGYASAKNVWIKNVTQLIERYKLYQFDKE